MISQNRYIRIVSGVGAGANVAMRELGMRVITQNALLSPGIVAEFTSPDAVASFFGSNSEEYRRAAAYLGFISKQITSPKRISFSRWVNSPIAPSVVGDTEAKSLANLKAVSAGTLTILVDGVASQVGAIDLSGAASLTAVAALLQARIRTAVAGQLAASSVTYNTNTNQFTLVGGVTGSGALSVVLGGSPAAPTDAAALLGWGAAGAINVAGQGADTALDAVQKSVAISNNMGSLVFATPQAPMTVEEIAEIALWNHSQNNLYIFSVAAPIGAMDELFAAVKGYSGCALNVLSSTLPNDFIDQAPCEILAATDYSTTNATQNYMFYQFGARNITVTDDATANLADSLRANYIGVTQSAGQQLAFYQRGVLCGDSTAAVDMNTYANEMWIKSAITSAILTFFLAVGRVPANEIGQGQILAILQDPINVAKDNGTISAGATLSVAQQLYITQVSGSATAWRQVATIGYWIDVTFSSYVNENSGLTEWKASYTLIYAKDNAIRFVEGRDILI
ncbi:hypothetical protein HOV04_gp16 [Xanthomonas phage XcP1]|uniref:Tail sheath protein n=1 Tax=Xanthomonas phage XcP1 TaxID=2785027 RepID=A0A3S7L8T2_9CAUD|nr:hypothetical protein HOV04_gp16 [Xanthomonas phage XcP1]AWN08518.1 hypothetical protein XcP1_016 [Xanthomonas phage XcP1]